MVGKAKSHTKADERRFIDLQAVGCICCRLEGLADDSRPEPSDAHHILLGGRRLGHQQTLPLCPWHHKGENLTPLSDGDLEALRGPSLARSKRAFVARYGTELELLGIVDRHLERLRRMAA